MDDSLDNLYSRLSLNDNGDNEVYLDEKGIDEIKSKGSLYLATKMLLRKPFNLDVMKSTLMKLWQLKDGLEIKEVSERVFSFYFEDLWFGQKFG